MDKKEIAQKRKNDKRHKKHVPTKDAKKEEDKAPKKKPSEDKLPSNWSKYEIKDHPEEEISEKANFETLLDEPLSEGSHFKFKNEESWSNNVEFHGQFQKYFTVDINLLNVGIACVPFTKRHGYDSPVLKSLDESSEKNKLKYQTFLNKRYPQSKTLHIEKPKEIKNVINKPLSNNEDKKDVKENLKIKNENKENKKDLENINENKEEIIEIKKEFIENIDSTEFSKNKPENVEKELLNKKEIGNSPVTKTIETNVSYNKATEMKKTDVLKRNDSKNNHVDEELDSLLKAKKIDNEEPATQIYIDEDPLMETTHTTKNVIPSTAADLEQWLDDILDD